MHSFIVSNIIRCWILSNCIECLRKVSVQVVRILNIKIGVSFWGAANLQCTLHAYILMILFPFAHCRSVELYPLSYHNRSEEKLFAVHTFHWFLLFYQFTFGILVWSIKHHHHQPTLKLTHWYNATDASRFQWRDFQMQFYLWPNGIFYIRRRKRLFNVMRTNEK